MPHRTATDPNLTLEAMLSEYRALYGLAEWRLSALDRRIPLVGGVLTGFLASVPILPMASQTLALVAVPISLIWLVRTTINHARSFEDALRGLEVIEQRVNSLLGHQALGFQSTHPSRGAAVGGRTGAETVGAVILAAGVLLGMCLWLGFHAGGFGPLARAGYAIGIATVAGAILPRVRAWSVYRYRSRQQDQQDTLSDPPDE